jgi:hypothetical protein
LLDQTPLPLALSAINGIDARLPHEAFPQDSAGLTTAGHTLQRRAERQGHRDLRGITATEPAEVVQTAKAMFMQQGWHVQGNVYQAAGDIHVTLARPPPAPAKTWLEKWQTWVAFLAALLSLITVTLDLPTRIRETFTSTSATTEVLQTVSGMVTDTVGESSFWFLISQSEVLKGSK